MRLETIKKRAAEAAARLIAAMPPGSDVPKTERELIELVCFMAQTPRKFGVYLTRPEQRALDFVHGMVKARLDKQTQLASEKAKNAKDLPTVHEGSIEFIEPAEGAGGTSRIQ